MNETDAKNVRELLTCSGYSDKAITYYLDKKKKKIFQELEVAKLLIQKKEIQKILHFDFSKLGNMSPHYKLENPLLPPLS